MSKNREKKHSVQVAEKKKHSQDVVESAAEHHEHHLVETPKGTSRLKFIASMLLVVFLLLIFSVTGPMMASLSGDGGPSTEAYLSWTMPEGEQRTLDSTEFTTEKRRFRRLENLMPYLLLGNNVDPGDDFELARFLILEQMARRSGIYVADSHVADTILQVYGSADSYKGWIARQRDLSASSFEDILRRGLVVRRYLMLASSTASEVLSDEVIDRWKLGAEEFNFEYVEAIAADFTEEAKGELPPDDELEDWFNALPAFQKQSFRSKPSAALDLAWYDPSAEGSFDTLFERYPRPEDEDQEEMAQNYYNSFSHIRFARPVPETEEKADEELDEQAENEPKTDEELKQQAENESKTDEELKAQAEAESATEEEQEEPAESEPQSQYFSFEEVADVARREAPIYYSMVDWFSHIQARVEKGEPVDLNTEAISLGFNFEHVAPRTREGWIDGEEPWSGRFLYNSVGNPVEGNFGRMVAVEEDALVITQVIESFPPAVPPFAEIRDAVGEKWVTQRSPEIAQEKLEAIRDAFGERPEEGEFETTTTAEEFKAAVEAAGFEIQERGYERQFPRPKGPDDRPTEAEFYIRSKSILFSLDVDTVIAAEATRDDKAAYLIRVAGKREGDVKTMLPGEAADTVNQMRRASAQQYFGSTYGDYEWVRREFNVFLFSLDEDTQIDA